MIEASILKELAEKYSACDISDALVKLKVPGAGFLADILPLSTFLRSKNDTATPSRLAIPISTMMFIDQQQSSPNTELPRTNLTPEIHWTEEPAINNIVIVQQPLHQSCAVVGDILATRLKVRGVKGVVVDGRVRDLDALNSLCEDGFLVWNRGTSTVGSGLEAKAWATGVPLTVGKVVIKPGDILFLDSAERGTVVIPRDKVDGLVDMLAGLKTADDAVVADVQNGMAVHEAFKKHRG